MKFQHFATFLLFINLIAACTKDDITQLPPCNNPPCDTTDVDTTDTVFDAPVPYTLKIPTGFPPMDIPSDNPTTVEGVNLGRMLFYDPILSADSTQACASCHGQPFGFTDKGLRVSLGIDGIEGNRNSMALINLGWFKEFFWDGRATSLEDQALGPVVNPVEMHNTWPNAMAALQAHPEYPTLFGHAFGTTTIDSNLVVKAIAQFERTFISGNSKYDKWYQLGIGDLTEEEYNGLTSFMTEAGTYDNGIKGADCFHCHNYPFFAATSFHNNGLDTDADFVDLGRFDATGDASDKAKFKVPTLRNIELTAPYMHDGRFQTLEEVVNFYNSGGKHSSTVDPIMTKPAKQNGLGLSQKEKADLVAFLKTLTDQSFVSNPDFSNPF